MVVFLVMIYMYLIYEFSWIIFFVFFLVLDLLMLVYGINNYVGVKIYNVCYIYIIFILIVLIGVYFKIDIVIMIGLIWIVYIGMDWMFGYGLKYEMGFKDIYI